VGNPASFRLLACKLGGKPCVAKYMPNPSLGDVGAAVSKPGVVPVEG
jgi:hypothetical protein